jgi:undecaprenyl-diphosphatase
MSLLQLIVIATVQGLTEFLPISSSAHLIVIPRFTNWQDQGLGVDVAVHVGTLGAVAVYFRRDIGAMLAGLVAAASGRPTHAGARMAGLLIVATIPVVVVGGALHALGFEESLRRVDVIGATMAGFGVLLFVADRAGTTVRRLEHLGARGAIFIGLAQVLALVPGTSRAGITITAARILGFERRDAARFSMLLSIPTIAGAGLLKGVDLYRSGDVDLGLSAAFAAALAFLVALASIAVMMAWLRRAGFTPFVVYRVIAGAALLIWW